MTAFYKDKWYSDLGDLMVQVKVFDEEHEDDLTEAINEFLEDNEDINLFDIKFSTSVGYEEEQTYCFSAMVIYSS